MNGKKTATGRLSEFVSNDANVLSGVSWMDIEESKSDSAIAVRNVIVTIVFGNLAFIFRPIDRERRSTCENKSTRVLFIETSEREREEGEEEEEEGEKDVDLTSESGTKFIRISLHDDRLLGKRLQEFRWFFVQGRRIVWIEYGHL